ncbi:MAG: helix-turn-helix transcriptional regulator [Chitinispirillia bacterium]|nr:helix-turn-helix transcriptional regulator [Chitinispirillia bacterium]
MALQERLKFVRKLFGYSQKEMGELLNIPQATYNHYENETREVPREVLLTLLQIGVDTSWLLTGTTNSLYQTGIASVFIGKFEPTIETVANKLNVPSAFIQAMKDGKISPSTEFFERIFRDGLNIEKPLDEIHRLLAREPRPPFDLNQDAPALRIEIQRLQAETETLRGDLFRANYSCEDYGDRIVELKERIVFLKEELSESRKLNNRLITLLESRAPSPIEKKG